MNTDKASINQSVASKTPMDDRQIAIIWSIEDVQCIRPDLDDEQSYEVLQAVKHYHDATIGVSWDTLEYHSDRLYPESE